MIQCPICQHENPEGAEYCENCGAALTSAPSPAASPASPASDASTSPPLPSPAPDVLPEPAADGSIPADQPAPEVVPPPGPESTASPPATGMQTAPLTGDEPAPPAATDMGVPTSTTPASAPPVTPSTGGTPRLVAIRHGAPTGLEFPLFGNRLVIGRFDPETGPVDIDLSDTPEAVQISRHHAEVFQEGGAWKVRDLGSTNGVFVKSPDSATFGPRISEPRSLSPGDEIAFGNARFTFQMDQG